jgi:hypothetical protein
MRAEVTFEPLTALAGGIVGGAIIAFIAWRHAWRAVEHIAHNAHRGARA